MNLSWDYENLSEYRKGIIEEAAEENGMHPEAIWDTYREVMRNNFADDIYTIIDENREQLLEDSKDYE